MQTLSPEPRRVAAKLRPAYRLAEIQAAEQPEYEDNNQHETKNAAEPRRSIHAVAIVATPAAQG